MARDIELPGGFRAVPVVSIEGIENQLLLGFVKREVALPGGGLIPTVRPG